MLSLKIRERVAARKQQTPESLDAVIELSLFSDIELIAASILLHELPSSAVMFQEDEFGDRAAT